jgi:hypothetical protein
VMPYNFYMPQDSADLSGRYYQIDLDDYCVLRVLCAICR